VTLLLGGILKDDCLDSASEKTANSDICSILGFFTPDNDDDVYFRQE